MLIQLVKDKSGEITADDMYKMQCDTVDVFARETLNILPSLRVDDDPNPDQLRQVIDDLTKWDGDFSIDSTAATLYQLW